MGPEFSMDRPPPQPAGEGGAAAAGHPGFQSRGCYFVQFGFGLWVTVGWVGHFGGRQHTGQQVSTAGLSAGVRSCWSSAMSQSLDVAPRQDTG